VYNFIFAIFLSFLTNSNNESGYSTVTGINANTSSQLIFDLLTNIEAESETQLDSSITDTEQNNKINQLTYLSKHSIQKNFIILQNKCQHLQARAPPLDFV